MLFHKGTHANQRTHSDVKFLRKLIYFFIVYLWLVTNTGAFLLLYLSILPISKEAEEKLSLQVKPPNNFWNQISSEFIRGEIPHFQFYLYQKISKFWVKSASVQFVTSEVFVVLFALIET